ncbi:hypothetical protein CIW52_11815 [Mycolicibacterium sp. P9-64]|nr:hypothetical protein CIW52_11815 [Mycolicibacterium sp. P9-64]
MAAAIGLAVVAFARFGLAVVSDNSRRAAASSSNEPGDSAGAVGDVPVNGSNTLLIRFAVTSTTDTSPGDGVGVVGASGTVDDADTGVVMPAVVTPDVDGTSGLADGASTTTWLAATVPFGSALSAVDAGELAEADDPWGFDVPARVVASFSEASAPTDVGVDPFGCSPAVGPEVVDG